MATNDHGNEGDDGLGLYDPLLLPEDFDDVMHMLDIPGGLDDMPAGDLYPPPAAAPVQNNAAATAGSSGGDDLLDLPAAMHGNNGNSSVDGRAPAPGTIVVAAPPPAATHDVGSSSGAGHQDALDCTGCQVLREILHSNGLEATKLCVHGTAGLFYHATIGIYRIYSNGLAPAPTHQFYINFRGRDYMWVKQYLVEYAQQRAAGGYAVVQDSISAFHDALCTSMTSGGHSNGHHEAAAAGNNVDQQVVVAADAAVQHDQQIVAQHNRPSASGTKNTIQNAGPSIAVQEQRDFRPAPRSAIAMQRERTRKMELRHISRYFHIPIAEAARALRVCSTVLKAISRRCGIPRWPYRKVRCIDSQIAHIRRSGNRDAATMAELERLTNSRRKIYAGLE